MCAEPRVSVCMAVYNGAKFLRTQVESIREQLSINDELVIVDDASQDDSVAILQSIGDQRISVHHNRSNLGVLATFEKALRLANGQIIFLSDQDDIWLPGKLSKTLGAFRANSLATLVVTDALLIDEEGRTTAPSFFAERGQFSGSVIHNFIKNKHLGCTLSFRRQMLSIFLPIPPDVPMHDIWFGLLNGVYGRVHYIDEPLTAYRRHSHNASPVVPPGIGKAVRWRYRLAKNLVRRMFDRWTMSL
jgi:glycosyltransferase involved in cell wall biosynthesis